MRAEDECRVLVTQFPNSKYVPQAQQMLRDTQEVLGQKEFLTGAFYHTKGSYPAAANRLSFVADQYPLFSGADEALWQAADSYSKMGDRFEGQAADDYSRIVRDYPLSARAAAAKDRLEDMKRPVPPPDPAAVARMKYEAENRTKKGMISKGMNVFSSRPDAHLAAKAGAPAMTTMRPPTPVSVPSVAAVGAANTVTAGGVGATTSDVSANISTNTAGIDAKPDARQGVGGTATPAPVTAPGGGAPSTPLVNPNGSPTAAAPASTTPIAEQNQPLPTNRQLPKAKKKTKKQIKQEQDALMQQQKAQAASGRSSHACRRSHDTEAAAMSRVLLADNSPHAQRMGERILREEGFEVITVSDGETAMLRLKDANPDLVIADISMPGVTGYQVCEYVKTSGNHPNTRVVLTASAMEPFDEAEASRVNHDGLLKKPFEASLLIAAATAARTSAPKPAAAKPGRGVVVLDPEQVRAAVTLALDASLAALTDQITEKVLVSLNLKPYAR